MIQPVLSVAIPTYNRAHLLQDILEVLCEQILALEDPSLVQVLLSDNASSDDTPNLIEAYKKKLPNHIFDHRNPKNIGATRNILSLGAEMCRTEYCWIIGDDDLIRPGALENVLKVISDFGPDLIYVNQTYEYSKNGRKACAPIFDESSMLLSLKEDFYGLGGERLIQYCAYQAFFTSLPSLVFKTVIWREAVLELGTVSDNMFDSLYNTFPHSVILADAFIKSKVYYVSFPYLAFYVGEQGWFDEYWATLKVVRVAELLNLFKKIGASRKFRSAYAASIFNGDNLLYRKLKGDRPPFIDELKIWVYISRYATYPSFWRWLFQNFRMYFRR